MKEFTSRDPRTGEIVRSFTGATPDEVRAAVARSRRAQEEWGALEWRERRPFLKALRDVLVDHAEEVVASIQAETGKNPVDVLNTDLLGSAALTSYLARRTGKILAPQRRSSWPLLHKAAWVEYQPVGVVGVISPWNYPFLLPYAAAVTAVAAGNTVVIKPSEVTPTSGDETARVFAEAGFPPDVVQVVHGGAETGKALIHTVDFVHFTGSPVTARSIAHEAAETLTPAVLELGGKDAMIILEDADVKRAAKGALWGGMVFAGQSCVSVERIYVVGDAYEPFVAALTKEVERMSVRDDGKRDIGPIIFAPQLEVIERHVADAVAKGARLVAGGRRDPGPGTFYEPTLLTGVDHTMEVMREETFGPVLAVQQVADTEEAVRMANDSVFGLHGSVWTRDLAEGKRVATAMRSGSVAINDVLVDYGLPDLPIGGMKESGYGISFGPEGVRSFTHPKAVTRNRFRLRSEVWWFPRRGGLRSWKRFLKLASRR
jgi:acyl-CoA reductase-like NAD-dependent aldehyde dehydrogenase